jgi:hypothetical protein
MTSEELYNGWAWATKESYKLRNILKRIIRFDHNCKHRLQASYSYYRKAKNLCPKLVACKNQLGSSLF